MRHFRFCVLLAAAALLQSGCTKKSTAFKVVFVPKIKNIPYFQACQKGAEEAGKELGLEVTYDGPGKAESNEQITLLETWLASGRFDAMAVACTERGRLAPVLRSARKQGLPVVTYDADTEPDARDYHVNMATYDGVAEAMVDALADDLGPNPKGKVCIVTSSLDAPNQSEWARRIRETYLKKYPGLELMATDITHGEDRNAGITKVRNLIAANHDKGLVGLIGLTSVAVPAAAEAVRNAEKAGTLKKGQVKITGVSTPTDMRDYVNEGTVKNFVLWSPVDLGYLTVHVVDLVRRGKMVENGTFDAGRLKGVRVTNREVLLGPPIRFTKENMDKAGF